MFSFIYIAFVTVLDKIIWAVDVGPSVHKFFLAPQVGNFRVFLGRIRAVRVYKYALRRTPAYRDYMSKQTYKGPKITFFKASLNDVPEIDKATYIKKYVLSDKLTDGILPKSGVMLDESSGSSGRPTSWARGKKERRFTRRIIQVAFKHLIEDQNPIVINTFAMGAWSTGFNTSLSLLEISRVKSTGPDLTKVIDTLIELGPGYDYVITGYPPFLKQIADDTRVDLSKYKISCIYGGEGISEPMRKSLLEVFTSVIGSYGASDLEINIAHETDFTIALRQALIKDESLRTALLKQNRGIIPMIFQYNPYDYLFENNDKGELLVSICRVENLSPRIRYNIHDLGHAEDFYAFKKKLKALHRDDLLKLIELDFGVLFYYGRSDLSVDYYGGVVGPEEIRQIINDNEEYKQKIANFRLISYEDKDHQKHLLIALELAAATDVDDAEKQRLLDIIVNQLFVLNLDFKAGYDMAKYKPELQIYQPGEGIFDASHQKLKNDYVWNIDFERAKAEGIV
ncbi:MAG: Coenzyme synthetase [Candidatus Saccharibacteria bacterium]|nr:Coenzyme synthetase [Candidatus Saccharibacteria bacterium]